MSAPLPPLGAATLVLHGLNGVVIRLGTGTEAPDPISDHGVDDETDATVVSVDTVVTVGQVVITIAWELDADSGNGFTLAEAGLWVTGADEQEYFVNRQLLDSTIAKTAGVELAGEFVLTVSLTELTC